MRPLKEAYFKKWNSWLVNALKAYTANFTTLKNYFFFIF
jgi:hypothetical protein